MRCSSLYPPRCPGVFLWHGYVPTAALQAETPAVTGTHETCRQAPSASAVGRARDCRLSDAPAAVMQVRPLSVVSGIADWGLFGRPPFGASGWL